MHAFDRRTDRIPIAIPRLHSMQRGKNLDMDKETARDRESATIVAKLITTSTNAIVRQNAQTALVTTRLLVKLVQSGGGVQESSFYPRCLFCWRSDRPHLAAFFHQSICCGRNWHSDRSLFRHSANNYYYITDTSCYKL